MKIDLYLWFYIRAPNPKIHVQGTGINKIFHCDPEKTFFKQF